MINSFLELGKTTPKSLETPEPLELPTGAEVIAVLETQANGEKMSAQDIQKAIKKKIKRKKVGKKIKKKHPLYFFLRLSHPPNKEEIQEEIRGKEIDTTPPA